MSGHSNMKMANPAVVGLAGFGVTTLLLQFVNLGWMSHGPVFASAVVYGGGVQLLAGFLEFFLGNNFGFVAFSGYGAFWISLALIWYQDGGAGPFESTHKDVALYLIAWTIFTIPLLMVSITKNKALFFIFVTLMIGFICLDIGVYHGISQLIKTAGAVLLVCALGALYLSAALVVNEAFQREILPEGTPFVQIKQRVPSQPLMHDIEQQSTPKKESNA
jgi:succinate-acetate transporter protein